MVRDRRPSRLRRRCRPAGQRARARLARQRAVHRRPPARDQPAHLDDRLPGGPEPCRTSRSDTPSARSRATSWSRSRSVRGRRGERFATTTRSSGTNRSSGVYASAAQHCRSTAQPRPAVADLRPRTRGGAVRLAAPAAAVHALPDAGRLRPGRDAHGTRRRGGHHRAARARERTVPLRARAAGGGTGRGDPHRARRMRRLGPRGIDDRERS